LLLGAPRSSPPRQAARGGALAVFPLYFPSAPDSQQQAHGALCSRRDTARPHGNLSATPVSAYSCNAIAEFTFMSLTDSASLAHPLQVWRGCPWGCRDHAR